MVWGPSQCTESTVNPRPNIASGGQNKSSAAQDHVILNRMKWQGGLEPAQLPKGASEVWLGQQIRPSCRWVCCPLVATVHFSLHIHDRDVVQDAWTCRSASRSSSRNFPVSCFPQIAPGQEHCGARKGRELGNRVAFSHHSVFSPFTLYTRHPENTLGQDRGRTHVPTILCLIITRFLSEGLCFFWCLET